MEKILDGVLFTNFKCVSVSYKTVCTVCQKVGVFPKIVVFLSCFQEWKTLTGHSREGGLQKEMCMTKLVYSRYNSKIKGTNASNTKEDSDRTIEL